MFQSRYCCQRVPPVTDVNTHTCDVHAASPDDILDASDEETARILVANFGVYQDFITEQEEQSLFDEVEPYLKRLRYEISHWDDVSIPVIEILVTNSTTNPNGVPLNPDLGRYLPIDAELR